MTVQWRRTNVAITQNRYRRLFSSSRIARKILVEFLSIPLSYTYPISLSHGIDFDHLGHPLDVMQPEPLHWCYNTRIYEKAKKYKDCIALPHPWLMLHALSGNIRPPKSRKALVIGPPPSEENDMTLLTCLSNSFLSTYSILLKERNTAETLRSAAFWESNGIETVSAGISDEDHLNKLFNILSHTEYVVTPYISSVAVLASAVGCKIILVPDYFYTAFAPSGFDLQYLEQNVWLQRLVQCWADSGDQADAFHLSRELLGKAFLGESQTLRERVISKIENCKESVYIHSHANTGADKFLRSELARFTGTKSFLRHGIYKTMKRKLLGDGKTMMVMKVNTINIVMDGLSNENFKSRALYQTEFEKFDTGHGASW